MKSSRKYLFATDFKSDLSRMYREIKTNLYTYERNGVPIRTILVTSARKGEGKSITAANLAVAFALDRKSVLLIDANFHDPQLHRAFARSNTAGLSHYLLDAKPFNEVVFETAIPGLDLLSSGPESDYCPSLLYSEKLQTLLQTAKSNYEVIIVDGIASEECAEVRLAASYCDGFVFVVNPRISNRERITAHLNKFLQVKAHLYGLVLNQV